MRVDDFRHLFVIDRLRELDGAVVGVGLVHRQRGRRWLDHLQVVVGGGDRVDHDVLGRGDDRNVFVHDSVVVGVGGAELPDLQVRRLTGEKKKFSRKHAEEKPEANLEERHVRCNQRCQVLRVALLGSDVRDHLLAALDGGRAVVRVGRQIRVRGEAGFRDESIEYRVFGNVGDLDDENVFDYIKTKFFCSKKSESEID